MIYDFDKVIDRHNTNSLKYDFYEDSGYTVEHIPLWVADMDFPVIEEIKSAISRINAVGIYGYTGISDSYYDIVSEWMYRYHNFKVEKDWFCITPGVVYALSVAVCAYTQPGESVIIQTPVYSPFYGVINKNQRKLVRNPLVYENGSYYVDFADFENKIVENDVKLFIMCNPHNPVGKVFTKEELIRMCHICCKHGVIIVSDEIHHDFVFAPHKHTVLANLNSNFEQSCVICTSPGKTFNITGLKASNIFIPNPELKKLYDEEMAKRGPGLVNTLGIAACVAAYRYGRPWLNKLLKYLQGNIEYVTEFINLNLPKIKVVQPQGTFLVWIDCKEMGLENSKLNNFFKDEAKIWLNPGDKFGQEGEGFQRINIATSRSILEKAMNRIKTAYDVLFYERKANSDDKETDNQSAENLDNEVQ